LCIRGISNLLINKTQSKKIGSQYLAAENAAAFVFELIYQLRKEDLQSNLIVQKKNISENVSTTQINIKSTGKDNIIIGKNIGNITLNKR
jgi:hypothetical protein